MESPHDPTTAQYVTQSDYILGPGGEQMSEYQMQPGGTMAWQHTNVWVAGRLLATYEQNTTTVNGVTTPGSLLHFYLDDPLGTRRVQADYAGNLEQTCSSLPYGDSESCGTTPTEHLFTGKERDAESGNDYFDARYYSSAMGRFMSPDWSATVEPVPYAKLDNPQTLNLYAYVGNNPMGRVDPDGHFGPDRGNTNCASNNTSAGSGCEGNTTQDQLNAEHNQEQAQQQSGSAAQQQIGPQYRPSGGSETVSGIAGILCGETCGEKDSKTENESLNDARDKIAHVRLNGIAKWGANVDKHAGMAPPNMAGAKAMLPIVEGAVNEMLNGVDPTHGAVLYNMRTAAQVKAGHDFWGYKVYTVSGPYNTPSPYRYIVTYGP